MTCRSQVNQSYFGQLHVAWTNLLNIHLLLPFNQWQRLSSENCHKWDREYLYRSQKYSPHHAHHAFVFKSRVNHVTWLSTTRPASLFIWQLKYIYITIEIFVDWTEKFFLGVHCSSEIIVRHFDFVFST